MKRKFTCIVCPNGCEIETIIENNKVVSIEGALCKKGEEYVIQEMYNPKRNIASSVKVIDGESSLVSVRLTDAIPKAEIFNVMQEIIKARIQAPTQVGQIVIKNVSNLNVDVMATKEIKMNKRFKEDL